MAGQANTSKYASLLSDACQRALLSHCPTFIQVVATVISPGRKTMGQHTSSMSYGQNSYNIQQLTP